MTHASVFSGIGGPEVAASMLGWENLFHCEINPFGRAVLEYWFPNSKSYEDITTTDFSEWGGRVNVLTGGFPCQPFSYAGQRRGADDDRYLWPYMHRCINQVRPDWVVCENVAGILTMVEQGDVTEMAAEKSLFSEVDTLHRYRLDETFTLERICEDLGNDGYAVQAVIIPACAVNAPHRRDRIFIIGHRNVTNSSNTRVENMREGWEDAFCRSESSSDSHGNRRSEMDEYLQPRLADGPVSQCDGRESDVTHSCCKRLEKRSEQRRSKVEEKRSSEENDRAERPCSEWPSADTEIQQSDKLRLEQSGNGQQKQEQFGRGDCQDGGVAGLGRWKSFPTQSPVHRGNDGVPFPLDDLTISPSKWRTESLKAYGNAIVPQVMYEIFKAIEATYQL